ncbi:MAG: hypothetical protein ABID38_05190 [Candidatus Diapherotrites archaeon]
MKRIMAFLILLTFLSSANAIVIIPPVVYVATISILTLVLNAFIGLFFWIAIQGVATKKLFGRPIHEILNFLIPSAGKILFALLLTVIFSLILAPVEINEIISTSILISVIFAAVLFLSKFREIRNTEHKSKVIASVAVFSIAVLAISFFSIMLSVEVISVSTEAGEELKEEFPGAGIMDDLLPSSPYMGAPSMEKPAPIADVGEGISPEDIEKKGSIRSIWLVPDSGANCTLTIGETQLSFRPEKNCVEKIGSEIRRSYCPIEVTPSQIYGTGQLQLKAGGSCSGEITILVSNNAFEVLSQ